jgi:alcohol dehydrogenase class IV
MNFKYLNTVNLIFGFGAFDSAGAEAKALNGAKAMVVTGQSSAKKSGALERLLGMLGASGIPAAVFDKASPNPTTALCEQGAELARSEGCGLVIGLGGGSAMDAAKGLAFSINNPGDLSGYIFGKLKQRGPVPPIMLIPTTCGTGSEGNSFAVLTNPKTGDKKSLRVPAIFPSVSIIDPGLMAGLPPKLLGEVAFDAMCHLIEAHLSKNAQPLTDLMSLSGLGLIRKSLPPVLEGLGKPSDWANLAWASTLGGMSIGPGCVAAPHGLEHPLSGRKGDIAHARWLAALCPAVYQMTLPAAHKESLERFGAVSRALGGAGSGDFLKIIDSAIGRLGLRESLTSLGLGEGDVEWLAKNALKVSAAGIANHPVVFTEEQIAGIYRQSL